MKARDERVALMNEVCSFSRAFFLITKALQILGGIRMLKVSCIHAE
jgi:hypothetical protein